MNKNRSELVIARVPSSVSNHRNSVLSDAVLIEIVHGAKEIIIQLIDRLIDRNYNQTT